MGTRTEYAPGTFSWVDLTTSDAAGAKDFYGSLLGWDYEDNEIPGGGVYSIAKVGGEAVAAISPSTASSPPSWNNYVTVASADDAAAKAQQLGGQVIEKPLDVMEAGRMALIRDPTGAALCLWEPRANIGAGRVNDPGALTWNELHTPDLDRALDFYTGLFGWTAEAMDTQGGPAYSVIRVGERSNGGAMDAQEDEPPNWLPYFTVEQCDGAVERAVELGGRELHRMDVPQGRIGILTDPQGAAFAVSEGEVDD